jgi:hypothetical protein
LSDSPITITDANFAEEVENSKLPVLIDFWTTWCPLCKMLAPMINVTRMLSCFLVENKPIQFFIAQKSLPQCEFYRSFHQ